MPLFDIAPARVHRAAAAERGRFSLTTGVALIGLFAGLVACDPGSVLRIPQPDNLNATSVNSAAALPALLAGTQSAFQIAYSGAADEGNGGHEGFINWTGLFVDEFTDFETFPTRIVVDERTASGTNASLQGFFVDMTAARAIADKTDAKYDTFAPDSVGHGVALALGGYMYVMFAEAYCEGVPVSTLNDNGTITYGLPLTRAQILQIAIQRFDSAITIATADGDANTANLAAVGLGRAQLDNNDDADAATAVASVPVGFVYQIGASTNSAVENNGIWAYTFNERGFSVADSEGTNGLPFISAADPRVPSINTGLPGTRAGTANFQQQQLYATQAANTPLATGIEAGLITAEHQLRTSGPGGPYFTTLNTLRATFPGLAPLVVPPATMEGAIRLLFHERAFWMYLTGHRLGDMRRLVRQYTEPVNTVFPIGISTEGVAYGVDVNFEISQFEDNNPNFHGCLNRSA
jgi:starch-binding outer membrane protein, SusD/RagB family